MTQPDDASPEPREPDVLPDPPEKPHADLPDESQIIGPDVPPTDRTIRNVQQSARRIT